MQQLKGIRKEFIPVVCMFCAVTLNAQNFKSGKKISTELFGLFFEDITYTAMLVCMPSWSKTGRMNTIQPKALAVI